MPDEDQPLSKRQKKAPRRFPNPKALIGLRVKVNWLGEGWFKGRITRYNPDDKGGFCWKIYYEDGDSEEGYFKEALDIFYVEDGERAVKWLSGPPVWADLFKQPEQQDIAIPPTKTIDSAPSSSQGATHTPPAAASTPSKAKSRPTSAVSSGSAPAAVQQAGAEDLQRTAGVPAPKPPAAASTTHTVAPAQASIPRPIPQARDAKPTKSLAKPRTQQQPTKQSKKRPLPTAPEPRQPAESQQPPNPKLPSIQPLKRPNLASKLGAAGQSNPTSAKQVPKEKLPPAKLTRPAQSGQRPAPLNQLQASSSRPSGPASQHGTSAPSGPSASTHFRTLAPTSTTSLPPSTTQPQRPTSLGPSKPSSSTALLAPKVTDFSRASGKGRNSSLEGSAKLVQFSNQLKALQGISKAKIAKAADDGLVCARDVGAAKVMQIILERLKTEDHTGKQLAVCYVLDNIMSRCHKEDAEEWAMVAAKGVVSKVAACFRDLITNVARNIESCDKLQRLFETWSKRKTFAAFGYQNEFEIALGRLRELQVQFRPEKTYFVPLPPIPVPGEKVFFSSTGIRIPLEDPWGSLSKPGLIPGLNLVLKDPHPPPSAWDDDWAQPTAVRLTWAKFFHLYPDQAPAHEFANLTPPPTTKPEPLQPKTSSLGPVFHPPTIKKEEEPAEAQDLNPMEDTWDEPPPNGVSPVLFRPAAPLRDSSKHSARPDSLDDEDCGLSPVDTSFDGFDTSRGLGSGQASQPASPLVLFPSSRLASGGSFAGSDVAIPGLGAASDSRRSLSPSGWQQPQQSVAPEHAAVAALAAFNARQQAGGVAVEQAAGSVAAQPILAPAAGGSARASVPVVPYPVAPGQPWAVAGPLSVSRVSGAAADASTAGAAAVGTGPGTWLHSGMPTVQLQQQAAQLLQQQQAAQLLQLQYAGVSAPAPTPAPAGWHTSAPVQALVQANAAQLQHGPKMPQPPLLRPGTAATSSAQQPAAASTSAASRSSLHSTPAGIPYSTPATSHQIASHPQPSLTSNPHAVATSTPAARLPFYEPQLDFHHQFRAFAAAAIQPHPNSPTAQQSTSAHLQSAPPPTHPRAAQPQSATTQAPPPSTSHFPRSYASPQPPSLPYPSPGLPDPPPLPPPLPADPPPPAPAPAESAPPLPSPPPPDPPKTGHAAPNKSTSSVSRPPRNNINLFVDALKKVKGQPECGRPPRSHQSSCPSHLPSKPPPLPSSPADSPPPPLPTSPPPSDYDYPPNNEHRSRPSSTAHAGGRGGNQTRTVSFIFPLSTKQRR